MKLLCRSRMTPFVAALGATGVVGIATSAPMTSASATAAQCAAGSTQHVTALPDTSLNNLFDLYGNSATGTAWSGGDGTESVALPDGRELWLYSDSFLGAVVNGWRDPNEAKFLHNSLVIEDRGVLTHTLYTLRANQSSAYLNLRPTRPRQFGFWPGATVVSGSTLEVVGLKIIYAPGGRWSVMGKAIAEFALPSLRRLGIQTLPASTTDWSGGILQDGGFTYLYGTAGNNTYAARVPGDDLRGPWAYFTGSGWSADQSAAVPIENIGTSEHFSVSKVGSEYVFVTKPSWGASSIMAAFGCSPVGPFGSPMPIYTPPEPTQYPGGYDIVTYGAHAHPELSTTPNTLVVSYDVDAEGPWQIAFAVASIYRPRFIDVTFS